MRAPYADSIYHPQHGNHSMEISALYFDRRIFHCMEITAWIFHGMEITAWISKAWKQCWAIYSAILADSRQHILFKISFFEAENGIFLFLFTGLKPLPLVLAYFDAFGIFKSRYDLEKSISKKYMLKYIKVYNPALPSSRFKNLCISHLAYCLGVS